MTQYQVPTPESGALVQRLDRESDAALKALIAEAKRILSAREDERKRQAAAEIRRIAKAHGLNVAVKKPARKRGRPARGDGTE